MSNETATAIARTEAASAVDPDAPIEDRFRAAFSRTHRHWMATDPEDQYRAGIEAVYLSATEDERERILVEARAGRDLGALMSGLPIDVTQIEAPENPIGFLRIWTEMAHGA